MTSVLGTSPATGSIATSSLASITVTFDGPIANDSLGFTDFDLDLVNPDGSAHAGLRSPQRPRRNAAHAERPGRLDRPEHDLAGARPL